MHSVYADKHGTQIIDLAAKPSERFAVMQPCNACLKDVAVASDFQGQVFCSEKCKNDFATYEVTAKDVLKHFADAEPGFYRCAFNTQQLVEAFQANRISDWTVKHLKAAFNALSAEGKLLPHITMKDIQKMSPSDYDRRLRLDPDLGGHRAEIEKMAKPVESAQVRTASPKNQVWQAMSARAAAEVVNARTNRYATSSWVNGEPIKAPEFSGSQLFRNGRLVR